jgi:hypothetical protein
MGARGRRGREGNMWIGEFTMERERERTCPTPTVKWEGKGGMLFLRLRWDFGGM